MPLYEYQCKSCGIIEVLQKPSEEPLTNCPKCNKIVSKILSVVGKPQFKGTGFYQTDYKKPNK
jgi:putative FmdB family regulatory protein